MTNSWKKWEGRTIDGKYVLGSYLGGSDAGAVFRTRIGNGENGADAAIRLVGLDDRPAKTESQLAQWNAASVLTHPSLIRILATGRDSLDGTQLVYAVEEFAEENLAQILPERALTPEEVRGMLAPVLAALDFVHGKGLVHGQIKPSNILAAGDQIKLSSDTVQSAGAIPRTTSLYDAPEVQVEGLSPASDVWSLGMTLLEVLTQHRPVWDPARTSGPEIAAGVAEPFRGIAQCCLQLDPAKRCTLRQIGDRLEGRAPANTRLAETAAAAQKSAKWPYLLLLVAVIVPIGLLLLRPHSESKAVVQTSTAPSQTTQAPAGQPIPAQPPQPQTTGSQPPQAQSAPTPAETKPAAAEKAVPKDDIVERVAPEVSSGAQRTIRGRIKVRVRVEVDAAGNVTAAKVKQSGSSRYFARTALEAAKQWKFAPANGEGRRTWMLTFSFSRGHNEMSAIQAR